MKVSHTATAITTADDCNKVHREFTYAEEDQGEAVLCALLITNGIYPFIHN